MAVVVEQTLPFEASLLDLENPSRWNTLLPLIRPNLRTIQTAKGQIILIDPALAKSKFVHVAAVGSLGNFSSRLLDDHHVTAVVTEQKGAGILTAQDIMYAMQSVGAGKEQGVVILRLAKRNKVAVQSSDLVEVDVKGKLEMDHMLHLLGNATKSCRASIHQTTELLKQFVKGVSTARSRFHTEKTDGNPAVLHAGGSAAFQKARHAVERDLKHVMQAHSAQEGQVVYSVCYSDFNGMSRLENYILAHEIAVYLDSKNIPYHLSHSTILDHEQAGRGWAISICPIERHYLSAQAKPEAHQPTQNGDASVGKTTSPSISHMTFSDAEVRRRIESGCNALIKEEPAITKYDEIVGDGDCGYTLRDGAKQVLQYVKGKDLAHLPEMLSALVDDLEVNMGGTSGALYCIFLSALSQALATEKTIPLALKVALEQLMIYTRARLGDRTMMDCLIPFVETLSESSDAKQALQKAKEGVDGTKNLEAKLGRSTYLDESATRGVPDPGAYGLWVLLEGLCY